MNELVIPHTLFRSFEAISKQLQAKKADYGVSVFISPKDATVTWVGGSNPNYSLIVQPIEKGHGLKQAKFYIPGDFFKHSLKSVIAFNRKSTGSLLLPLIFELEYKNGKYINATHVEIPDISIPSLNPIYPSCRKFDLVAAFKKHVEYIDTLPQRAVVEFSIADLDKLDMNVNPLGNFEYLQLESNSHNLRFQRGGNVGIETLSSNIPLPVTLTINNETYQQLRHICQETQSQTVAIAQEGELITIRSPEKTVTRSIAGLTAFIETQQNQSTIEVTLIADIQSFKGEIESHADYKSEKKADQCYFLIDDNKIYMSSTISADGLSKAVYAKSIKSEQTRLYRFHPKELINTHINDLISMAQVKICIVINENHERFFEFYSSTKEGSLPYVQIPVETIDTSVSNINKIKNGCITKTVQEILETIQQENGSAQNEQLELIGF